MAYGARHLLPGYNQKILLMLRAGDCTEEQIKARHGLRRKALGSLERGGFLIRTSGHTGTRYSITHAGLEACQPRNPASVTRKIANPPEPGNGTAGCSAQRRGGLRPAPERFY